MSHFTVLVVGPNPEVQLEPFNEQDESLGYHVFEDETEEFQKEFETGKDSKSVAFKKRFKTFAKFMKEYHELKPKKGRYGYVRNPNAKWDWFQLGGRWRGFFKSLSRNGILGDPGVGDNKSMRPDGADQLKKGDIAVEAMREEAKKKAREYYDKIKGIVGNTPYQTWESIVERLNKNYDAARIVYADQAAVQKLKGQIDHFDDRYAEVLTTSREHYSELEGLRAIMTFAMLKDGKWHEKGQMGWFGTVSGEKDVLAWAVEFNALFDSIPDDTIVSVYDCHI